MMDTFNPNATADPYVSLETRAPRKAPHPKRNHVMSEAQRHFTLTKWEHVLSELDFLRAQWFWTKGHACLDHVANGFVDLTTGSFHSFEEAETVLVARCQELGITIEQVRAYGSCPSNCFDEIFVNVPANIGRMPYLSFDECMNIIREVVA